MTGVDPVPAGSLGDAVRDEPAPGAWQAAATRPSTTATATNERIATHATVAARLAARCVPGHIGS